MVMMFVIRPVSLDDLDRLFDLAGGVGYGLTSLPRDRELLHHKISESIDGFARLGQKPRGDCYLFVLEDLGTGQAVGTTGIVSKVGGFEPFYAYAIETALAESAALKVRKEIKFLKLVTEHNGPCEIGSLFLLPECRKDGNGRLLSLVRFLFMAEYPRRFDPTVIAELRGIIDDTGHAPFWDGLGHHFFDTDYPNADYLSVVDKRFIADLMPRHPIYIPLLPKEAQGVIGKVHPQSVPAAEILREEGFRNTGMVDIFDAGPIVSCPRDDIRTVRESRKLVVEAIVDEVTAVDTFLIAAPGKSFRACRGPIEITPAGVRLRSQEALALQVKVGDAVRFVTMKSSSPILDEVKPV
jgi:arginine N-succinyltransferase